MCSLVLSRFVTPKPMTSSSGVLAFGMFQEACGESGLPEQLPDELDDADEATMQMLHRLLVETHVQEGQLECPETGRRFPIASGIPNMLLNEDEC